MLLETNIKDKWKNYFHKLLNEGYEISSNTDMLDTREEDKNYNYNRHIHEQMAKEVLKRMSNGKIVGLNNIPIEVWKHIEDRGNRWLTKLFCEIIRTKKMSNEWRINT